MTKPTFNHDVLETQINEAKAKITNEDRSKSATYTFTNREGAIVAGCLAFTATMIEGRREAASIMLAPLALGADDITRLAFLIRDKQMPKSLKDLGDKLRAQEIN